MSPLRRTSDILNFCQVTKCFFIWLVGPHIPSHTPGNPGRAHTEQLLYILYKSPPVSSQLSLLRAYTEQKNNIHAHSVSLSRYLGSYIMSEGKLKKCTLVPSHNKQADGLGMHSSLLVLDRLGDFHRKYFKGTKQESHLTPATVPLPHTLSQL